ncbi:SOS response-associated peptidase family protein [Aquabacterium sp.]|uniref:SOS response-associated peptidase family protein n=1 Tax=Aquabacterium sp. TaxID=1872578 RepID=UPI0037849E03
MCYSAQIRADYRRYVREWQARISLREFVELFWWKWEDGGTQGRGAKPKIPKAMELAFVDPQTDDERLIKRYIDEANAREALALQAELFKQRKRLADAERALQGRPTKKAAEDQRIAGDKVRRILGWLADLGRTEALERDARIFPLHYAPVMVWEDGQRVIKPMRYGCRPAGVPAFYDTRFPGTYNARRDNLQGFWRKQFGHTHAVMVANAFYENVPRHKVEGRELAPGEAPENQVLEFRPRPTQEMLVACLWSRWSAPGERELLSFAAITDEPPPEVAAAGHDRCIIPIKPEHLDEWLNPQASTPQRLQAILDDRERPYYEHRLAA